MFPFIPYWYLKNKQSDGCVLYGAQEGFVGGFQINYSFKFEIHALNTLNTPSICVLKLFNRSS